MGDKPLEQMTLREMFVSAESLIRDVEDHLAKSFIPKLQDARELIDPAANAGDPEAILDNTVRQHNSELLESDDYSQSLLEKLLHSLNAIDLRSQEAINSK